MPGTISWNPHTTEEEAVRQPVWLCLVSEARPRGSAGDVQLAVPIVPVNGPICIGRSPDLDHPRLARLRGVQPQAFPGAYHLSGTHALVQLASGGRDACATITDLRSKNGTFVDGDPLAPDRPIRVQPGSVLRMGGLLLTVEQGELPEGPVLVPACGPDIVSACMRDLLRRVLTQVRRGKGCLLLTGPTGCGKSELAVLAHRDAGLPGALVRRNLGEVAETLLDYTLFGRRRGGVDFQARDGLLLQAHRGMLLLEEIAELPLAIQGRLLTVFDTWKVQPVDADRSQPVELVCLGTTNLDVEQAVKGGALRADFRHRLSQDGQFELAPLAGPLWRDAAGRPGRRAADIAANIVRQLWQEDDFDVERHRPLAADALEALCLGHWPGGFRELRRVLKDHVLATTASLASPRGPLAVRSLSANWREKRSAPDGEKPPRPASAADLLAAVARCGGDVTRTAREVYGVRRATLYRWLEQFNVVRPADAPEWRFERSR